MTAARGGGGGDIKSVTFLPEPQLNAAVDGGERLDGRGLEDFREVCESLSPAPLPMPLVEHGHAHTTARCFCMQIVQCCMTNLHHGAAC